MADAVTKNIWTVTGVHGQPNYLRVDPSCTIVMDTPLPKPEEKITVTQTSFDSRPDTWAHIHEVQARLNTVIHALQFRAHTHDCSKLVSPEVEIFDAYSPLLKNSTYGSDEYKGFLKGMGVALDHHYSVNSHHPEHFSDGTRGMNLLDVLEMLFFSRGEYASKISTSGETSLEQSPLTHGLTSMKCRPASTP